MRNLIVLLGLLIPSLPHGAASPPRALVISADGAQLGQPLTAKTADSASSDRGLETCMPLHDGQPIDLHPGGELAILCSDGSCRRLTRSVRVGPELCDAPPAADCPPMVCASSRTVAAAEAASADWLENGEALLLGPSRGTEEKWGRDPVLVSPRCPATGERACTTWLETPDSLVFLEVEGARRYLFRLQPGFARQLLDAEDVENCEASTTFDGRRLCRHPWPGDWTLPEDGGTVTLTMAVETAEERRFAEIGQRLRLLPAAPRRDLEAALGSFAEHGGLLGEQLRALLRLELGPDSGLYADLLSAPNLSPALELLLARFFLERDFPRPALHHLERLAEGGGAREGDIQLMLAWTHLELGLLDDARGHLCRAESLGAGAAALETLRLELDRRD